MAIEVSGLTHAVDSGRVLLDDVTFSVGDGQHAALVGANGTGKTTLLRLLAGELPVQRGTALVSGRMRYLRQFVVDDAEATVRDLLVAVADPLVRRAAEALEAAERALPHGGDAGGMAYAQAVIDWGDLGGYEAEAEWDLCCAAALREPFAAVRDRPVKTLSGGEQKRLALESLFRSSADVLLLDEPDNFLDLDGKAWLEQQLRATSKSVLLVTHDRALLAAVATKIVTLEARGAWTHGGGFVGYAEARAARHDRIDEVRRRHGEERARLEASLRELKRRASFSDVFASRAKAMEMRLARFDRDERPPDAPERQDVRMRLDGGRTGRKVVVVKELAMPGLFAPFSTEVRFGERVAVVGPNGTGKSHFLRLLSGQELAHDGEVRLGARVEPGTFTQLHDRADLDGRKLLALVMDRGIDRGKAMAALRRYELHGHAEATFGRLSGGQQARVQLLALELANPTLLLLDEPTDNLDLHSAEALEAGLAGYEGTVIAVSHDRWFLRAFERYLVFERDGTVRESYEAFAPVAAH